MDGLFEALRGVWGWMAAQGLAGDVMQWISGTLAGVLGAAGGLPVIGGVVGWVTGLFSSSASYDMGIAHGQWLSGWARKLPVIGPIWEFIEDPVITTLIRGAQGTVQYFRGMLVGANKDDKRPVVPNPRDRKR